MPLTAELRGLRAEIEGLWERREQLTDDDAAAREIVLRAIELLDGGVVRVAEVDDEGNIQVRRWLKHAIVMLFRVCLLERTRVGPLSFADRLPPKVNCPDVRLVPGAYARFGSYIAPGAILMPSFVNVGAYIGIGTLVDTWATVGSCAQIGEYVHLSGGVGIGGVLEPPQAAPVIVESEAFVGSRCILVEGAHVGRGAVLGAGLILSPTIPVIDAESGEEISRGHIPSWSVAVAATRPRDFAGGQFGLPCALVIKRLAEGERPDKVKLAELVRSHGATL
jgi:2,3,4,5-tetrahydropyridine-2,6-dicarboxylate N-succinyltransferase